MTWTYSGNPSSAAKDEVRFLVGDTDTTRQLVTDEEIAYALAQASQRSLYAASIVCRAIAAKAAKEMARTVGSLSISYKDRYDQYVALADKLESQAKQNVVVAPVLLGERYENARDEPFVTDIMENNEPFFGGAYGADVTRS